MRGVTTPPYFDSTVLGNEEYHKIRSVFRLKLATDFVRKLEGRSGLRAFLCVARGMQNLAMTCAEFFQTARER
jgi:hypothetical protein